MNTDFGRENLQDLSVDGRITPESIQKTRTEWRVLDSSAPGQGQSAGLL